MQALLNINEEIRSGIEQGCILSAILTIFSLLLELVRTYYGNKHIVAGKATKHVNFLSKFIDSINAQMKIYI
jgi:hypothetical protein